MLWPKEARVTVRRLTADDVESVHALHRRLSPRSLYLRYLRPYTPTEADSKRICQLPADKGGALAAVIETLAQESTIVGLAEYAFEDTRSRSTAEPAFVVDDAYQGRGLGRLLFSRLAHHAFDNGVGEFHIFVHPENQAMLRLIHGSGFRHKIRTVYDTLEVNVLLPRRERSLPQRFAIPSQQLQIA